MPQYQDLASGNLTAPVIFALRKEPELLQLIESEFKQDAGAIDRAIELVYRGGGIDAARQLANQEAELVCKSPNFVIVHFLVHVVGRAVLHWIDSPPCFGCVQSKTYICLTACLLSVLL